MANLRQKTLRALLVASLVVIAMASLRQFVFAAGDPMSLVQSVVNQAFPILRDKSSSLAERQQKLRAIVDANFDFAEMSRSALGPHWRDLTDAQRQEFSEVFKTFIEDSYLSKINEFSAQKVDFVRQTTEGAQYAQVFTNVEQQGSNNLAINYRLLKEGGTGDWKVYDVTVDNISIIANYRNQFNRIINNKGYNTLVTDLKNKQAALAASLVSGQ